MLSEGVCKFFDIPIGIDKFIYSGKLLSFFLGKRDVTIIKGTIMLLENQSSIPVWGSSFSGKGSSFGDQIRQRNQMATVMIMSIKNNNFETAKRAFSALILLDKELVDNPIIINLSDALSSNDICKVKELASGFTTDFIDFLIH